MTPYPKEKRHWFQKFKVDYYHHSNDWMTAVVFEHWLGKWNKRLARQKCLILLLVDNTPSLIAKEYSNIRVQYLLPNTTSKLQQLDQGIICVCKLKYHSLITDKLCHLMDSEKDIKKLCLASSLVQLARILLQLGTMCLSI